MIRINPEKIAIRKKIISLIRKKKTTREIAYLLDIGKSTVSYWKLRNEKTNSLNDLPKSGHPAYLTKVQLEELKLHFLDYAPERYGGESLGWTTKMAIDFVKINYGVKYSMRRMQELFHKFGLNRITPRSEAYLGSKLARNAFRDQFKKNLNRSIWIASSLISTKQPLD